MMLLQGTFKVWYLLSTEILDYKTLRFSILPLFSSFYFVYSVYWQIHHLSVVSSTFSPGSGFSEALGRWEQGHEDYGQIPNIFYIWKKEDFSTLFPSIDVSWSQGCSTSNLRSYFDLTLTFKLHTVSSI